MEEKLKTKKVPFRIYLPATKDTEPIYMETIEIDVYENFGHEMVTTESSQYISERQQYWIDRYAKKPGPV